MKTYEIEIRRSGCGWGSLPYGSLRAAWERHCARRQFASREEAAKELADAWWECAYDVIEDRVYTAHPDLADEPPTSRAAETLIDDEYRRGLAAIREAGYAEYDDGGCRIVESDEDGEN